MDVYASLRLQIEWGADEALDPAPVDRLTARAPKAAALPQRANVSLPSAMPVSKALEQARILASSARTTIELRAALAAFDGCALATTATNLVFADGGPDARLMVIGDVPGAEEDRDGRPFVGPPGRLLDRMFASIGLDRTQMLLTNVVAWRPPGNRMPSESEIQLCVPFLLRHIALAQPHALVLLGAIAAQTVLGTKASITRIRGRWTDVAIPGMDREVAALAMVHPGYLLQHPEAKRQSWTDLLSLRHRLESMS